MLMLHSRPLRSDAVLCSASRPTSVHHAAPTVSICPREPEGCVLPALGGRSRRWRLQASNRGFSEPTPADRFKQTAENLGKSLRRTATDVSDRVDLPGKAQQAANTLRDGAETVDSRFGIRHKLRALSDDVQRQAPRWQRQYQAFARTTPGKIAQYSLFAYLIFSGLAFKLLNILFLALWVIPLVAVPLAQRRYRRAQQAAQQRPGRGSPQGSAFTMDDLLRNLQSQQAGRPQPQQQQQPSGRAGPSPPQYSDIGTSDGPVIDAEWTTIDEDR